ncbi:unnamed protein product [Chrysoparadoxa australica]
METTSPEGVTGHTWKWRDLHDIYYEQAGEKGPPVVLLPGFGVGSFHFHRNIQELAEDHRVYALDFIGQGRSWPTRPPTAEDDLRYGVDTWCEQISCFLEEVVKEPAFLVGNSLGGYLAIKTAALKPQDVRGVSLLNATPFWAFNPADKALIWDGTLPAPPLLYRFGAFYFDQMRNPGNIEAMLKLVYRNTSAIDDDLVNNIMASTERGPVSSPFGYGNGGHEAFTSILFAPKSALSFESMLDRLDCPVLMCYGRDDPWVTPFWGKRIKRRLPDATYLELAAGHCPHHEHPKAVNTLVKAWVTGIMTGQSESAVMQSVELIEVNSL